MSRILLAAAFVLVLGCVFVGGHLYLAQRLVLDPELGQGLTRALSWALGLLAATVVLEPIGERTLSPPWSRVLAWPAALWLGAAFLLLLLLAASDLLLWLGGTAAWALAEPGAAGSGHALAWSRVRAVGVSGIALVAGATALRSALAPPRLRRVEVPLGRWPAALDGFRIVQLSDVHVGPILGRRFARELVARVNALAPDLVAVTGDLVDGRVAVLREEVAPFAELRARHGVFFVTGNHDHYSGARAWAEHAERALGFRVLRNRRVTISDGADAAFELAGVDDHNARLLPGEHGEDLDAALADLPDGLPVVLLAHDPSTWKRAAGRGVDLQLSGHTHGGQIWPFVHVVRLFVPFVAGLYRRGASTLYVSRGTGFWGPPMRLRAPAEITELVLRRAEPSSEENRA